MSGGDAGRSPGAGPGGKGGPGAPEAAPGRKEAGLPRRGDLPPAPAEVHLMGAGGDGMRGLAVLLGREGYRVSGCDRDEDAVAPEITERGGRLHGGHDPEHVADAGLLVRSSAVPDDHPEVEAARQGGVPVLTRARALAALVNDQVLVGVSGTHGKTTITAMTTLAAAAAGLDATGVVGGRVPGWGGHVRVGEAGLAVVEADEFDGSFLELDPDLAVVSSVEPEHLESYGESEEELRSAFRRFAERASARLGVLYCADDAGARRLAGELEGGVGYGTGEDAQYRVEPVEEAGEGADGAAGRGAPDAPSTRPDREDGMEPDAGVSSRPDVDTAPELDAGASRRGPAAPRAARLRSPAGILEFRLAAPGRHNLLNAAAALAAALRLGADPEPLASALAGFRGVERRLEPLADAGGVAVVDDYAHHPTEVRASLAAVREAWPGRRVVAVFQPHLFSRTRRFAQEFAEALEGADEALVLPVYPAREEPIPGVDAGLVAEAGSGLRVADREEALERVRALEGPAVVLFMGAGDVTAVARTAAGEVRRRAVGA